MWKYAAGFAGIAAASLLEKNKYSGRWQLILVPKSLDDYIGQFTKSTILQDAVVIVDDSSSHRCVDELCKVIYKFTDVEKEWNVTVIENEEVNAFVLPDGSIFVYTGLLKLMNNVDELGFVLAHELSHVLLRHSAEKITIGGLWLVFWMFIQFYIMGDLDLSAAGNLFIDLPLSRTAEKEADAQALQLMHQAGLDLEASISVMDAFEKNENGIKIEFLSTHPLSEKRAKDLEAKIKEMNPSSTYKKTFKEIQNLFSNAKNELAHPADNLLKFLHPLKK